MLGHFPPSRPDECLYSIACEYKRRLGHPSHHHLAIRQDLFGFSGERDLVDIPTGLDYLIAHLPRGFNVDLDYLLWHTTALPYFAPFLTPTQLDAMIGHMRGAELNNRHYLLAPLRKASNRMPGFLRYCPFCAAADRDEWGATYWHRLHQLPSVHLCHKHEIELANSHIPRGTTISKALIHADDVVDDSIRPRHQVSSGRVQLLAWLSEQTEWILQNPTTVPDRQRLQDVYRYYFYLSGFGSISGILKKQTSAKKCHVDIHDSG
jgi:TniQ